MRVKAITLIALAVLLVVSSVTTVAGYISAGDQSQLKTAHQGLFAYPAYNQKDSNSLQQIEGIYKDMLGVSKDMYDNRGSDLVSKGAVNIPFLSGDSIPGPMDLITAMAPAGYASNVSMGNRSVKKSLIGTSLF